MRVLVTGGAGFIGSHLVDALLESGHSVAVLDNLSSGLRSNLSQSARLFEVDLIHATAVRDVVGEVAPDAIYHFAAQVSVPKSFENPVADAEANILGLLNLLDAARELKSPPRFVFASSGGAVYGNALELPSTEETEPNPATPYGIAKLAAEMYLALLGDRAAMPYVILRFANVYGPRQGSSKETGVCAIFTKQAAAGRPLTIFGDGSQTRDYVYVTDIAAASLQALGSKSGEVINLGSGVETSTEVLARLTIEVSGGRGEIAYCDERLGDVPRACLNGDKARRVLGWQPRYDLRSGLSETIRWYRQVQADGVPIG